MLGLLHGLGISFVLSEILDLESPDLWQSLLAFNVGIEVGQLLIVVALGPLPMLVAKRIPERIAAVRWAVALPCILIAGIWTGERAVQLEPVAFRAVSFSPNCVRPIVRQGHSSAEGG